MVDHENILTETAISPLFHKGRKTDVNIVCETRIPAARFICRSEIMDQTEIEGR